MKAYIITEKEMQALMDKLELTSLLAENDQFIQEGMTTQQIAEAIHRRFRWVVREAFSAS